MARKTVRTLADMAAAAKLRGEDLATVEVMTRADAEAAARKAAEAAAADALATAAATVAAVAPSTDHHACGIPGCRHGAIVNGAHVVQPDRQVKIACPTCGAVARMTHRALTRAGGMPTCHDGTPMVPAERRTYSRRSAAAE